MDLVSSGSSDVIDYVTIGSTGNATGFSVVFCKKTGRPLFKYNQGLFLYLRRSTNTIEFVAIDTTGNATDFGDIRFGTAQLLREQHHRISFGFSGSNEMAKVSIATTGDATDFGDATMATLVLAFLTATEVFS